MFPTRYKVPEILVTSKTLNFKTLVNSEQKCVVIPNVPLGIHDVTVRLINKDSNDTVVDSNGTIIEDLYAVIEDIYIDQLSLKNSIDSISWYKDNNNNEISTFGWLSFNQDYSIILQVPGWYFLRNLNLIEPIDTKPWLKTNYYLYQQINDN